MAREKPATLGGLLGVAVMNSQSKRFEVDERGNLVCDKCGGSKRFEEFIGSSCVNPKCPECPDYKPVTHVPTPIPATDEAAGPKFNGPPTIARPRGEDMPVGTLLRVVYVESRPCRFQKMKAIFRVWSGPFKDHEVHWYYLAPKPGEDIPSGSNLHKLLMAIRQKKKLSWDQLLGAVDLGDIPGSLGHLCESLIFKVVSERVETEYIVEARQSIERQFPYSRVGKFLLSKKN